MLRIGITGGIGSGKTHLTKLISDLGYPIYSSDKIAKEIIVSGEIKNQLIKLVGKDTYIGDEYNSAYVLDQILLRPALLGEMNKIIHPLVNLNFSNFADQAEQNLFEVVFKESALIYETGDFSNLDLVLMITSPLNVRRDRVLMRSGMTVEKFDFFISQQWSDELKINLADLVICNDYNNEIISKVLHFLDHKLS